MINYATMEFGGGGKEIFEPLLRSLVSEARSSKIVEFGNYRKAVTALSELSDISIEKNRPVCQLMTEMTEWLPEEISTGSGKITETHKRDNEGRAFLTKIFPIIFFTIC